MTDQDPNAHVTDYLRYYTSIPYAPHFAVMVSGPWGSGKTFIVRQFFGRDAYAGIKVAYVSLYGVESIDQLETRILASVLPSIDHPAAKIATGVLKTVASFWGGSAEIKAGDFSRLVKADVWVFDDLERSAMPVRDVMGYINRFVEHEDCKVILVANEAEIADEAYLRVREKLVGQTVAVVADVGQALDTFLSTIRDEEAAAFLGVNRALIESVY